MPKSMPGRLSPLCERNSPPTTTVQQATFTPVQPTATPTPIIYTIRPGDTLSSIAARFDVPLETLADANGIENPNLIKVNQKLIIPIDTPEPTATVPPTLTPTPNIPPQLEIIEVIGRGAPATETVLLVNRGRDVNLYQWTLRDAQGNIFMFPMIYLAAGTELRVHTGMGKNIPLHLYWNREQAVWEESGDTVILADDRGVVYSTKPLD